MQYDKKTSCYPRWQQYNTCLAALTVTGKGRRKIELKAKHFSIARKINLVGQTKPIIQRDLQRYQIMHIRIQRRICRRSGNGGP